MHSSKDESLNHLRQQPSHAPQYYSDMALHKHPGGICHLLAQNVSLIIANDGGAMPQKGSVGWVIASDTGGILATGCGISSGEDPRSYRAGICTSLA